MAVKNKTAVPDAEKDKGALLKGLLGRILARMGVTTGAAFLFWGGFWFIYNMVLYLTTSPEGLVGRAIGMKNIDLEKLANTSLPSVLTAYQTIEHFFTQSLLGLLIAALGVVILYQKQLLEFHRSEPVSLQFGKKKE